MNSDGWSYLNSTVLPILCGVFATLTLFNCFLLCVLQIWDASTGQGFLQYNDHLKRAWSVDFSQGEPTKLASGSDDCSVKLWSIKEVRLA